MPFIDAVAMKNVRAARHEGTGSESDGFETYAAFDPDFGVGGDDGAGAGNR
jgi:hypothetical protein